jgi:hypothetical protein
MIMKWFDRDYVTGGLDDVEWERRRADYADHLNTIGSDLGDGADELIASVNLHDAQVQEWACADGVFKLRVLAGDLQRGYEFVTLLYEDAELHGATAGDLARWRVTEPGVDFIEDEVDIRPDGRYEHRLLLWPEGEFAVTFRALRLAFEPAQPSHRR